MTKFEIANELLKNTEDESIKYEISRYINQLKENSHVSNAKLDLNVSYMSKNDFDVTGFKISEMSHWYPSVFENENEQKMFITVIMKNECKPCYSKGFDFKLADSIEEAVEKYEDKLNGIKGFYIDSSAVNYDDEPEPRTIILLHNAVNKFDDLRENNFGDHEKHIVLGIRLESGEDINLLSTDGNLSIMLDASFMEKSDLIKNIDFLKCMSYLHDKIYYDKIIITHDENGKKLDEPVIKVVKDRDENPFSQMLKSTENRPELTEELDDEIDIER